MGFSSEVLEDPVALTRALVDIESVSGNEREITDAVEVALRTNPDLRVERDGNVVLARASGAPASTPGAAPGSGPGVDTASRPRVVLASHLDTVPVADNLPARVEGDLMHGCGTGDMKSGAAIALHLAVTLVDPGYDLSYIFYDCEEVEAARNGLNRISTTRPDWMQGDLALLLEPTHGVVEAGCQGTIRVAVRVAGKRAHSARSWHGVNAIHASGAVLERLRSYQPRSVQIDGCRYREGMNAVGIAGGVAGNVIPDECEVTVNYRFAPNRSEAEAEQHLREIFHGYEVRVTDSAPGALPGLSAPVSQKFLAAVGQPPRGKFGWTDAARFSVLGVPALNFGPGDPNLSHTREEHVEIPRIVECADVLRNWLCR